MATWTPTTPKPPNGVIERAAADIPPLLADMVVGEDGQVTISIEEVIAELVKRNHSTASSQWAIVNLVSSDSLILGEMPKEISQPGPSPNSVTARRKLISIPVLTSTKQLWDSWRATQETDCVTERQVIETGYSEDSVDIAIFIALEEEFDHFFERISEKFKHEQHEDFHYYMFSCEGPNGHQYQCVVTFAGQAGETRAALVTQPLLLRWKPSYVVVLGIAGSLDEDDATLCDVIVATSVQSVLENSKAVPVSSSTPNMDSDEDQSSTQFELDPSGETYRTSDSIVRAIQNLPYSAKPAFVEWRNRANERLKELVPADAIQSLTEIRRLREKQGIVTGHIATGPTVGAAEAFKRWLKKRDRKFLALEMESGGVLAAVAIQSRQEKTAILRGISDFSDTKKKKTDRLAGGSVRTVAMANATDLFFTAARAGVFGNAPVGTSLPSVAPAMETSQVGTIAELSSTSPIPGCEHKTRVVDIQTPDALLNTLAHRFAFVWEQEAYDPQKGTTVFWPVRLREPTPIHAVQAFAAAAMQSRGARVMLYLDDLGNSGHASVERFTLTVKRWLSRVNGNPDQLAVHTFSQVIGDGDPGAAWIQVEQWLGNSEVRLLEVLRISKLLKRYENEADATIDVLRDRRPRRLLSPAMVWTCLADLLSKKTDSSVITLSGYDEKVLWDAWRRYMPTDKSYVGHLYNPNLDKGGAENIEQPLHMAVDDLSWKSLDDIVNALTKDAASAESQAWKGYNRLIPWCHNGCVSLPSFVASGCTELGAFEIQDRTSAPEVIPELAKLLDNWLLQSAVGD